MCVRTCVSARASGPVAEELHRIREDVPSSKLQKCRFAWSAAVYPIISPHTSVCPAAPFARPLHQGLRFIREVRQCRPSRANSFDSVMGTYRREGHRALFESFSDSGPLLESVRYRCLAGVILLTCLTVVCGQSCDFVPHN